MEKLFQLLKTHRNDILEYRLQSLYDDSLKAFKDGVHHVEDDLIRFIQEWDDLLVDVSDKSDAVGRIFESHLQVGLSLQTFAFSYIVSQMPEQYRDFVHNELAIILDIDRSVVNPRNSTYYDKEKLEARCRKFASISGLSAEELRKVGNLIETKYDKFFQLYGEDYQKVKREGSNGLSLIKECIGLTDAEFNNRVTALHENYGGKARFDKINLVFKVSSYMEYSKNLLCEILKS